MAQHASLEPYDGVLFVPRPQPRLSEDSKTVTAARDWGDSSNRRVGPVLCQQRSFAVA